MINFMKTINCDYSDSISSGLRRGCLIAAIMAKTVRISSVVGMLTDAPVDAGTPTSCSIVEEVVSDHRKGNVSQDEKKEDSLFKSLQRLSADQKNAGVQMILCRGLNEGSGVKQIYAEAFKYLQRLSIDQKNADAQMILGFMYLNGYGVKRNFKAAERFYKLAANQGNVDAQITLGFMYFNGCGVIISHAKAIKYFKAAANQGHAQAQHMLRCLEDIVNLTASSS